MFFAYIGEGKEAGAFGLLFPNGEPVEVLDEHAIRKLSNNPQFVAVFDGVQVLEPAAEVKRRGRPPKVRQ